MANMVELSDDELENVNGGITYNDSNIILLEVGDCFESKTMPGILFFVKERLTPGIIANFGSQHEISMARYDTEFGSYSSQTVMFSLLGTSIMPYREDLSDPNFVQTYQMWGL